MHSRGVPLDDLPVHIGDPAISPYLPPKKCGFTQPVTIKYRSAEGRGERVPELPAQLVRRHVAVIVTIGTGASARAAKAATSIVPIVFGNGVDPIETGLVRRQWYFIRPRLPVDSLQFFGAPAEHLVLRAGIPGLAVDQKSALRA
jgi:hypothetical protein